MPLSEHEQQMLAQMEQALAAEDPRFASQMQASPLRGIRRRRLIVGGVSLITGLALVLVGVNSTMWVGVVGFAVMVAGAAYALTPPRQAAVLGAVGDDGSIRAHPAGKGRSVKGGKGVKGSRQTLNFMQRLDERWDRRQHGDR